MKRRPNVIDLGEFTVEVPIAKDGDYEAQSVHEWRWAKEGILRDQLGALAKPYLPDGGRLGASFRPHWISQKMKYDGSADGADGWHHDCGEDSDYLIMWADSYPTEVRNKRGLKWWILKQNRVYLVDNHKVVHRRPKAALGKPRNFVVVRWGKGKAKALTFMA